MKNHMDKTITDLQELIRLINSQSAAVLAPHERELRIATEVLSLILDYVDEYKRAA